MECQNITELSCDLTAETPSQPNIYYMAKVMVNGSCLDFTTRFLPLRDSKNLYTNALNSSLKYPIRKYIYCPFFVSIAVLGPPRLSTRTTASALFVHVSLQEGPNGVSIADIINASKEGYSKTIPEYILRIKKPEWAAQVSSLKCCPK